MTTDVINDVPRELLERIALPMERDSAYLFQHRDDLDELRTLLATAKPVSAGDNLIRFDFTNGDGRPDSKMMTHDEMRQRYSELRRILATAQPAADGEREAEAQLQEWARGKFTFSGRYKGSVYGNTDWAIARAIHADLFKRHQPQQTVAVTEDVRRLREALTKAKGVLEEVWEFSYEHGAASALSARDMAEEISVVLSTHKTGEEE